MLRITIPAVEQWDEKWESFSGFRAGDSLFLLLKGENYYVKKNHYLRGF